jgi:hypothetical protein
MPLDNFLSMRLRVPKKLAAQIARIAEEEALSREKTINILLAEALHARGRPGDALTPAIIGKRRKDGVAVTTHPGAQVHYG